MVSISPYNNEFRNVNIYWDDEPLYLTNYKEYGLYGYYSTKFLTMTYDKQKNKLTITDSNGKTITLTY